MKKYDNSHKSLQLFFFLRQQKSIRMIRILVCQDLHYNIFSFIFANNNNKKSNIKRIFRLRVIICIFNESNHSHNFFENS